MKPLMEEEQRGIDRRVFMLEQKLAEVTTRVAVTEAKIDGLIETIKSRFVAFDRGIELILHRISSIEAVKYQAAGALLLVRILGIISIIGGVVGLVRLVKGT